MLAVIIISPAACLLVPVIISICLSSFCWFPWRFEKFWARLVLLFRFFSFWRALLLSFNSCIFGLFYVWLFFCLLACLLAFDLLILACMFCFLQMFETTLPLLLPFHVCYTCCMTYYAITICVLHSTLHAFFFFLGPCPWGNLSTFTALWPPASQIQCPAF